MESGGDKIQVLWDEEDALNKFIIGKGCGCKGQKCDGLTCCRSCYGMCKPYTVKCKTLCNNLHNNSGTCSTCAVPDESEASDEEDEDDCNDEQNDDNGEVIPISPNAQHCGIDTDLDISDGDEQMTVSSDKLYCHQM